MIEAWWRQNDPDRNRMEDYWTGDMYSLSRKKNGPDRISEDLAGADRFPQMAHGGKAIALSGYVYEALVNDEEGKPYAQDVDGDGLIQKNLMKFGFRALPEFYGKTGRLTFQVNQDGTLYSKDLGRGAEANPPQASWEGGGDPTKDGWKAVD